MKGLIFLLIIVLSISLTGCAMLPSQLSTVPKMQIDKLTVIENQGSQQINQQESLDSVISDYIIKNVAFTAIDGKVFEAHQLYGTEEKNGETYAYLWSYLREFGSENGVIKDGSGSSMPMVIVLSKSDDEKYTVLEYKTPQDGEYYLASVKKLFPEKYQDTILKRTNVKMLEEIVRQKAENFFNSSEKADTPVTDTDRDGELKSSAGRYIGQIDQNSIEIKISCVPEEKAIMAFRLSDSVKSEFDSYGLKNGDAVEITYFKNGYDQLVIMSLKR
jgi:hypothetical protein